MDKDIYQCYYYLLSYNWIDWDKEIRNNSRKHKKYNDNKGREKINSRNFIDHCLLGSLINKRKGKYMAIILDQLKKLK